jgi:hypothetical protein
MEEAIMIPSDEKDAGKQPANCVLAEVYPRYRWLMLLVMFLVTLVSDIIMISPAPLMGVIAKSLNMSLGDMTAYLMGLFNLVVAVSCIGGGSRCYRDLASALSAMKVAPTCSPWRCTHAATSALEAMWPKAAKEIATACRFIGEPFQKLRICARVVFSRYRNRTNAHAQSYYILMALASSGYPSKVIEKSAILKKMSTVDLQNESEEFYGILHEFVICWTSLAVAS